MRWRTLGQRLLRVCATWVRDRADRVLIRIGAAEDGIRSDERRRPSAQAGADGGPPEHWRRLVDNAPPRHWLDRVEAARRRFKSIEFDAFAQDPAERAIREARPPFIGPSPDPPRRERSLAYEPTPSDRVTHEEPPLARQPRSTAPANLQPPRDSPRPERRPIGTSFESPLERRPASRPRDGRVDVEQPTIASGRSIHRADVERRSDTSPVRQPAPPAETFAWRTNEGAESVRPGDRARTMSITDQGTARRAHGAAPLQFEPWTASRDADALVWPDVPLPDRRPVRDAEPTPATSVHARSHKTDEYPVPPHVRAWSAVHSPEPHRPRVSPRFEIEAVHLQPADVRSDERVSYPNEQSDRWPALPDPPPPADPEDWLSMKRRLDRMERLDREQRGW